MWLYIKRRAIFIIVGATPFFRSSPARGFLLDAGLTLCIAGKESTVNVEFRDCETSHELYVDGILVGRGYIDEEDRRKNRCGG